MTEGGRIYDVAVIGGGLAGLTAAALAGRAGKSVVVYERAETLGGRAGTRNVDGFHFNLGPHALFRAGHAIQTLGELGIHIDEAPVGGAGSTVFFAGGVYPMPVDLMSIFKSRFLPIPGRVELMRFLATAPRLDARAFDRLPLAEWLAARIHNREARMLIEALIRLSTYSNAPRDLSAGAALDQFQTALRGGVIYLNGGWQTLVNRIRDVALQAGVIIHTGVTIDNLAMVSAHNFILAVPPKMVSAILGDAAGPDLLRWIDDAKPVRAACLDLGLRALPVPNRTFSIGIDQPLYFSAHSRWADLAPSGNILAHVAKYIPWNEDTDTATHRAELERFLDQIQPGWRDQIAHHRFMPRLNVMQSLIRASDGGFKGRPAVDSPRSENVYIAGDWVGDEGLLADAAFASARRAARLISRPERSILEAQAV
ncbi:MAG TPA: FAD-dependent oxidoreductase [Terriglobia bacterium]|nr:FAD-dependent oxidoreductase [Terriglobia bacterium]